MTSTKHCPRCGGGHLFDGWFRMKERCPTCGVRFEREPGFFVGAYFINFAVALLQENSERAMMGRVMSIYGLGFSAAAPIGYAQAAWQVSLWGPQTTIAVSAGIAVMLGIVALLFLRPVTRLA